MMASRQTFNVTITDGVNPHNITSSLPSEAGWSSTYLPAIIGQLEPLTAFHLLKGQNVPILMENGVAARDAAGKAIRDFPFLPRRLSNNLEAYRMEAYFRFDPRLQYQDLWARMPIPTPQFSKVDVTRISQRRQRQIRRPNNGMSWLKGPGTPRALVEVVENLTSQQLAHNTTWNVTPTGILRPGTTGPLLPLTTFLEPGAAAHTPSRAINDAITDLLHLQQLARDHGLNESDWKELPVGMMPREWKAIIETPKRVKLLALATGAAAKATPMQGWYRQGGWKGRPKQAGGDMDEMEGVEEEPQRDTVEAVEAGGVLVGGVELAGGDDMEGVEVEGEGEDEMAQWDTAEAVEAGRALTNWLVAADVEWDEVSEWL